MKNISFNRKNMRYRGPIESNKYNQNLFQIEHSIDILKKEIMLNKEKINNIVEQYYLLEEGNQIKSLSEQNGIVQSYDLITDILRKNLSKKER